jgi:hypothetical protein
MRKTTLLIAAGLVSLVAPLALALLIVACAGSAGSGHSSGNKASTSHASGPRGQSPVAVRSTSPGPVVVDGNGTAADLEHRSGDLHDRALDPPSRQDGERPGPAGNRLER